MPITAARTPTRGIHERVRVPLALRLAGRALRGLGLLPLALPASLTLLSAAPAGAQTTTVWSATLTVAEIGRFSRRWGFLGGPYPKPKGERREMGRGCFDGGVFGAGAEACSRKLSASRVTYNGGGYGIRDLSVEVSGSNAGRLDFGLNRPLPAALEENATLNVGGTALSIARSRKYRSQVLNHFSYGWSNTGLSWTVGQSVPVSLTLPASVKTLTPSYVTATLARIQIANHTAGWWYKQTAPSTGTCTSVAAGTAFKVLRGLTARTWHTYKAYSAAGCNTADEITSATFLTIDPVTLPTFGISVPPPAADCPPNTLKGACVKSGESLTVTATLSRAVPHDVRALVEIRQFDANSHLIQPDINHPDYCLPVRSFYITIPAGSTTGTYVLRTSAGRSTGGGYFRLRIGVGNSEWPDGVEPGNHTVVLTVKDVPPAFESAVVSGNKLVIKFSEAMGASKAATGAFNVQVAGSRRTVSSYGLSGDTATLELSSAVTSGQTVTVAYAKPSSGNVLEDTTGNDLASFGAQTVRNATGDTTAPLVSSAEVYDRTLVVTFDEVMDPAATPAAGAFTVNVAGAANPTVSSYDLYGDTAVLTLSSAVTGGRTVTLDYGKPASAPFLQDFSGNALAGFTGQSVTNHSWQIYLSRLPAKPGRPAGVTAAPGVGQVTLSWTAASDGGAPESWVYRRKSGRLGYGGWTGIPGDGDVAEHVVSGLTAGTAYTFQVRAVNAGGEGPESAPVSATPVAASTPAKPAVTASVGDGQVTLSWTAIAGTTGWQVRQRTVGVWGAWTAIAGSGAATAGHVATGLANGTLYGFQVRAENARGVGAASDEDRARPVSATGTAPAAPATLTATVGDGEVVLGWTTRTLDLTVRSWESRRREGAGAWGAWTPMTLGNELGEIYLLFGMARTYIVGGLANGTGYGFEVRAVNARGPGAASAEATATPAAPANGPAKPEGVNATGGNRRVTLGWEAMAEATGWEYQQKVQGGGWGRWYATKVASPGTATGVTVPGLTNGVQYTFRVRAVDADGPGAASDAVPATPARTLTKPPRVADLAARSAGETSVRLTWSIPAAQRGAVEEWQVRLKTTGDWGEWTGMAVGGDASDATGWTVAGLTAGTAYTFQVRGRNAAHEGDASNEAAATPGQAAPDAVASVRVVHNGSSLTVSWDAPAGATHYDVTYTDADAISWARAAWNRAGTSLTITCDVREGYENQHCIASGTAYLVGVRARNAAGESAWVNSARTSGPALSVADASVAEGPSAALDFAVTLAPASSATVTVAYATADGTATAGSDYTAASGTLTFAAGETAKTVRVALLDDAHDEGSETLTLTLSDASGAALSDAEATGTITNADPLQKDWLARFGRAAAADAIAAVTARLQTPRDAGSHLTLGGQRLTLDGAGSAGATPGLPPAASPGGPSWPSWSDDPSGDVERTMSARELLMGTSFRTVLGSGAGAQWTGWGQGASVSAFSSAGPGLSLSGETATGSLGMDFERGRLLAGFAMTHSAGEGTAHGAGRSYAMGSTVTTMLPYARYALSERVSAWGLAGTGSGRLTLDLDGGAAERYGTDLAMSLAAVGVRGDLVTPAQGASGLALALKADAFWVRTESAAVSTPGVGNLAGARAEASRLRAVLDGSRTFSLSGGATLTPSLELGLRHDGGDAETGRGFELGAGLGYADASRGLDMALRVHGLAAHRQDGYSEWGVSGSLRLEPGGSGRGLSASLTPSWGADPAGAERLWTLPDAGALAANGDAPPSSRLDAEAGFGLAVFGGGFTGTPHVGFGLSDAARELRMGCRLTPAGGGGFELNLDAVRREAANDDAPEHRIGFGVTARW